MAILGTSRSTVKEEKTFFNAHARRYPRTIRKENSMVSNSTKGFSELNAKHQIKVPFLGEWVN